VRYPVATTGLSRLLGLALLGRGRAGPGLVIPRCRSVHTFGMRFALDVCFLDVEGRFISRRSAVPPNRIVSEPRASAVVEVPSQCAGASVRPGPGSVPGPLLFLLLLAQGLLVHGRVAAGPRAL
jgi:hypothetical protein